MPVSRVVTPRAKTRLDLAVEQETAEALELAGEGPRALGAQRARTIELIQLKRDLTDDEQHELKQLTRRWRERKAHDRQWDKLSAKARRHWAKRAGTAWSAKWEQRATEAARRYDSNLEREHLTGEQLHWLWAVTGGKKRERKDAKREAREQAEWAAEVAEKEARIAKRREPDDPEAIVASPRHAKADAAESDAIEAAPRRRRKRFGVVAQFDLQGRRVE